jgi:hypothetical protein
MGSPIFLILKEHPSPRSTSLSCPWLIAWSIWLGGKFGLDGVGVPLFGQLVFVFVPRRSARSLLQANSEREEEKDIRGASLITSAANTFGLS